VKRLGKIGVIYDALTDEDPQVIATRNTFECVPYDGRILIVILFEWHLGRFHFQLFFVKFLNHVFLFYGCHGEIEDVDVVDTYSVGVGLGVPWTFIIGRESKVGI
jgi:hypothetical protein